jgi:mannose-6-phosphate isomerase
MKASRTFHLLPANHVPVYYAGGAGIERFRRQPSPAAGPEDWIGSVSALPAAILPAGAPPDSGVSRLRDGTSLRDAIAADRTGWLGADLAGRVPDGETGLLVKLLDAGERLPVHAHPDRPFAAHRLASPFGKTEGWIVMDDAPGGDVWLGFRETVTLDQLRVWIEAQAVDEMLAAMNRLPATPGAVFYVPAGVPHAIGPGVMITELQEPTSFSILAEYKAFGLDENQATLGLGWADALSCFDLDAFSGARLEKLRPKGRVLSATADATVRQLFDDVANPFFQALRVDVTGTFTLPRSFAVLIVERGAGTLAANGESRPVTAGETLVVPFAAAPVAVTGDLRVLVSLPPAA